ncbi:hypothetical protein AKO1_003036 [Acrasis kona]|uniref:Uncharacterized protein n=1 Tax=Acrasis kona TaxID=1008807 RepID=A0AAW2ZMP9_9EUKA
MLPSTLEDLDDRDDYDVIYSNLKRSEPLQNHVLVSRIIQSINPQKFNLKILQDVFQSFATAFGKPIKYDPSQFSNIPVSDKRSNPVHFEYDNKTWCAKVQRLKWENYQDNNKEWNTYSIKLPNDGYIYHHTHEDKTQGSSVLCESSHSFISELIDTALNFFDDDNISIRVFYLNNRSRMNVKVKSVKHKAWLQITFEYGYPKQHVTNGWFTKEQMEKLINKK